MSSPASDRIVTARRPTPVRKWIRTHLLERTLWRLPRTDRVLDLCCGYGFYFGINPRACGIDGDARAVELLRRAGHDVVCGDVLAGLPYPDGRFEAVIAHDVLEHFELPELRRLTAEAWRVLRPGGLFVVIVPNRKGYDYGVAAGVGHRLFVTEREVKLLAEGRFTVERSYPEPLPRALGRFFTHNKEVFLLRRG